MASADPLFGHFGFSEVASFADVDGSLEQIMKFFGGDSTRFLIYFGRFLDGQNPELAAGGSDAAAFAHLQAEAQDADLYTMQQLRRRTSMAAIHTKLGVTGGRKLSVVEKAFVVDAAIELAATEDQEEAEANEDEAELLGDDEDSNFKFLPYNPIPGDEVDEALAEELNVYAIDVDIRRSGKKKRKGNKAVYKLDKEKFFVRYIHGVLVCKDESKAWVELIPKLREKVGMAPLDPDAPVPAKKTGRKIKITK